MQGKQARSRIESSLRRRWKIMEVLLGLNIVPLPNKITILFQSVPGMLDICALQEVDNFIRSLGR